MTIYHFAPRFQEFHLEYDKLEERPHVPSTFNYNPAQQAFWLAVSPTACLPLALLTPLGFSTGTHWTGRTSWLLSSSLNRLHPYIFFHIFVPSLPHYRYYYFFKFHTSPSVWFGWSVKWTTDSIHRHKHCKVSIWLSDSCFCSVLRIDYFCLQKLLRETRF